MQATTTTTTNYYYNYYCYHCFYSCSCFWCGCYYLLFDATVLLMLMLLLLVDAAEVAVVVVVVAVESLTISVGTNLGTCVSEVLSLHDLQGYLHGDALHARRKSQNPEAPTRNHLREYESSLGFRANGFSVLRPRGSGFCLTAACCRHVDGVSRVIIRRLLLKPCGERSFN